MDKRACLTADCSFEGSSACRFNDSAGGFPEGGAGGAEGGGGGGLLGGGGGGRGFLEVLPDCPVGAGGGGPCGACGCAIVTVAIPIRSLLLRFGEIVVHRKSRASSTFVKLR